MDLISLAEKLSRAPITLGDRLDRLLGARQSSYSRRGFLNAAVPEFCTLTIHRRDLPYQSGVTINLNLRFSLSLSSTCIDRNRSQIGCSVVLDILSNHPRVSRSCHSRNISSPAAASPGTPGERPPGPGRGRPPSRWSASARGRTA